MQLMANTVSEVMSSSSRNPNPRLFIDAPLQKASGDRTFESGSHLPIHPRITLFSAALSTRELQPGSSEAVFSKRGRPLGRFCGSMESVRCLIFPCSFLTKLVHSRIREKRALVRFFSCVFFSRDLNCMPALRSSRRS